MCAETEHYIHDTTAWWEVRGQFGEGSYSILSQHLHLPLSLLI